MIALLTYYSVYSLLALISFIGVKKLFSKQLNKNSSTNNLSKITLVVPFRNEEKRIVPLLKSLNNSTQLPATVLFIDDNSSDQTCELIQQHLTISNFQILASTKNGKKAAIQTGVAACATEYFLTLDADVAFESNYFENLIQLPTCDLTILPVKMNSNGWQQLFELDVYLINVLNQFVAGYFRPIVASGANLLVRKSAYLEAHSLKNHEHFMSGDDQFLLADFVRSNKTISLQANGKLAVTTPSPSTLKELMNQRLRWIQKTPQVNDKLASAVGAFHLLLTIVFCVIGITLIAQQHYLLAVALFAFKSIADALVSFNYFRQLNKIKLLALLPLYELTFPIYTLLLALISLFYQPTWKERKTILKL